MKEGKGGDDMRPVRHVVSFNRVAAATRTGETEREEGGRQAQKGGETEREKDGTQIRRRGELTRCTPLESPRLGALRPACIFKTGTASLPAPEEEKRGGAVAAALWRERKAKGEARVCEAKRVGKTGHRARRPLRVPPTPALIPRTSLARAFPRPFRLFFSFLLRGHAIEATHTHTHAHLRMQTCA